jgi:hypothetical protein
MRPTAAQQPKETKKQKAPSIRTPNYIYNIADVGIERNRKVVKRMSRRLFLLRDILTWNNHASARNSTSLNFSIVVFPENEIVSHDSLLDYIYNLAYAIKLVNR